MANSPDHLAIATVTTLAKAIRERTISSREVLEEYIEQNDRVDPMVNALVTIDLDRAREAARRADEAAAHGEFLGPLHGIPFTVKDSIETAGLRSTAGAAELADHVPTEDAAAVGRLKDAGGVLYGKSNTPRWNSDPETFNDLFGTTNNPWDLTRTPGASSGGSAAAVSAGLSAFDLGGDLAGSIRSPAAFCGVFGLKPSYGLISQDGGLALGVGGGLLESDIRVFGPLARSAEDLDLLLGVLAGPTHANAKAWSVHLPAPRHEALSDYRVGVWLDSPEVQSDPSVDSLLAAAVDSLAAAGAKVSDSHPPIDLIEARKLFMSILGPITLEIDPETEQFAGNPHSAWLRALRARAEMEAEWARWFQDFDVLLTPVQPRTAFRHNQQGTSLDRSEPIDGQPVLLRNGAAWCELISVARLPAVSVPVGLTAGGLPVGMQVVGPYLEDRTAIRFASHLASLTGGYRVPPLARRP
jgi:amidase